MGGGGGQADGLASSPGSPIFSTLQVGQNQGDRCRKFEFFDQYVTISYELTSKDTSAPLLQVENCDLHGNSIVSTPRWLWWN